jgi:hypothetical protein
MGLRQKRNSIAIVFLYITILFMGLPTIATAQEEQDILEAQRVQFGYWEIVPVVENILDDWKVSVGTYTGGAVGSFGTVEEGTGFTTLRDVYGGTEPLNWLIDPDGSNYVWSGEKEAKFSENLKRQKTREELITELLATDGGDHEGGQDWDPEDLEGASDGTLFDWASDAGIDPILTRVQTGEGPIITDIYKSAPPVGFSVGNVYLSDAFGNHWSKVEGGLFEDNYTQAVDSLSFLRVVPNYQKNISYIYREVPYSMKVCFWTQGIADFAPEVTEDSYLVMGWYYQAESWFFGKIGFERPYWIPSKTASASFQWVPEVRVEALPVTVGLDLDVIAPLWTARATEIIETPDGTYQALYNNTWIGFAGATITHIDGGIIDPSLPSIPNAQPIDPTGKTAGTDTANFNNQIAPETSELFSTDPNKAQKVTPAPSTQARDTAAGFDTQATDGATDSWMYNNFNSDEVGSIMSVFDGEGNRGLPRLVEGGLVADIDVFEPYWLAASQAQESAMGNVQNVYTTSANGDYEDSWNNYQTITGIEQGDGNVGILDYTNADANYIDHTQVESDFVEVDRQYSDSLALSLDMPNRLSLKLGATMKPAVHSWYRALDWTEATFRDQVWSINNREVRREGGRNTIEVLAGMEVLNVYMTYTVTFNVIILDRYDHGFTPGVNRYTGDELAPWVKTILHDNYYNETYSWEFTPIDYAAQVFGLTFWLLFLVFGIFFIYRGASKKRQLVKSGGGELSWGSAIKESLVRGIILGFVAALIAQLIINILTGGFPWNILF